MTFNIEITEILQRVVEIEADTVEEALSKVESKYARCDIVLDSFDIKDFTIKEARNA